MRRLRIEPAWVLFLVSGCSWAQPWSGILDPSRATDWSAVGIPGGIPSRPVCATVQASAYGDGSSDATAGIQTALNACPSGQALLLSPGTFLLNGKLSIPSNRSLRGSGANQTILRIGYTGNQAIAMGDGYIPYAVYSTPITAGASAAGATSIVVSSASGISIGSFLEITELNAPGLVTIKGAEGNCGWCDGSRWGASRTRGQIVEVTSVNGTTIGFTPGLYTPYVHALPDWSANTAFDTSASINPSQQSTHVYTQTYNAASPYTCTTGSSAPTFPTGGSTVADGTCIWKDQGLGTNTMPLATYFTASDRYAGVENLQVYSTNAAVDQVNISMYTCAYCWIKGVESNYTGGDHVQVWSSYRGEIRDSYFSNAYKHVPGNTDSQVYLMEKTTGFLVENNILERLHVSLNMSAGSAGNVIAYNYILGNFDSSFTPPPVAHPLMQAIDTHGAHPQFNLWEGNVTPALSPDSLWGSSSHNTMFRNWSLGTSLICPAYAGRGTNDCSTGVWSYQTTWAIVIPDIATYYNIVGNIAGSGQLHSQFSEVASIVSPATRAYEHVGYDFTFGYKAASDSTGTCSGTCPSFSTALMHGNYTNADGALGWSGSLTHTLPPSFYLSAKPSWWGTAHWPAIGPDVTGGTLGVGGHAYAIPAQVCYASMGGTNGTGSPLSFNAAACYEHPSPAPPTSLTVVVR